MARPELVHGARPKEPTYTDHGTRIEALIRWRDVNGELHKMKASGRTKTEARENVMYRYDMRAEADSDATINGSTTIKELGELWLKSLRGRATGTIDTYRNRLRITIVPAMGHKKISQCTAGYIESALRTVADGGTKTLADGRTVATGGLSAEKTARTVLKLMFDYALSYQAVPGGVTPVLKDTRSRERRGQRQEIKTLTRDQYLELHRRIKAWQDAGKHGPARGKDLAPAVDVLLGTGMRTGELLAMQWVQVNLKADVPFVLVTATIATEENRQYRQDWTKGDRDQVKKIQPIALPGHLVRLLLDRRAAMEPSPDDLVFPNRDGGLMSLANFRRAWRQARSFDEQNGDDFEWISPKSMRKTAATTIHRGLGLDAAAAQLRHSSSSVTLAHYIEQELAMVDNRGAFDDIFPKGE